MKRLIGLLAATALLTGGALVGSTSAGAAATTTPVVPIIQNIPIGSLPVLVPVGASAAVYAIHGLNLDGQDAQSDGGTPVTVCADGATLIGDFQFGDIGGPVPLPYGADVNIAVYLGANVPCGSATPAIDQDITVPAVPAVALVATAGPNGVLTLLPVVLDVDVPFRCDSSQLDSLNTPQGNGANYESRLGAVHAAAAPEVAVSVDGTTAGELVFGESLFADVPANTYSVEVTLGGTPIVGPADIDIPECTLTVVYVVGNQPVAAPVTTTTTGPAPAAAAVTARPAFTG